jgi:hypothetical protein
MIKEAETLEINISDANLINSSLPSNFRDSVIPIDINPMVIAHEDYRIDHLKVPFFIMTERVGRLSFIEIFKLDKDTMDYCAEPIGKLDIINTIKTSLDIEVQIDFSYQNISLTYLDRIQGQTSRALKYPINLIVEQVDGEQMITRIVVNSKILEQNKLHNLYKIIWKYYLDTHTIEDDQNKNAANSKIEANICADLPTQVKNESTATQMRNDRRALLKPTNRLPSSLQVISDTPIKLNNAEYLRQYKELRKSGVLL